MKLLILESGAYWIVRGSFICGVLLLQGLFLGFFGEEVGWVVAGVCLRPRP